MRKVIRKVAPFDRFDNKKPKLTKEVAMTDVPVKGEKDFTANVKIIYKNGKLYNVELIKNSTKPLPPPTEINQ